MGNSVNEILILPRLKKIHPSLRYHLSLPGDIFHALKWSQIFYVKHLHEKTEKEVYMDGKQSMAYKAQFYSITGKYK